MHDCFHCGTPNPAGAEFCSNCGTRLVAAPVAPPSPTTADVIAPIAAGCAGVILGLIVALVLILLIFSVLGQYAQTVGARVAQFALIALGVGALIWILRAGRKLGVTLQVLLIATLITALGAFTLCSSLFLMNYPLVETHQSAKPGSIVPHPAVPKTRP